jgi:uroporphyrinogen-III synthase
VPRSENPTILITRPVVDAERFLTMLRADAGSFEAIMCPAFGFEEVSTKQEHFDAAIFTSKAGVSFAPEGAGRVAYCVGDATAQLAQDAGYVPQSANGSAEELVALILRRAPTISLQHVRGEISRGNVTERLVAHGINCTDVVAYRKVPYSPPESTTAAVAGASQLVLPLFSAETVSIIAKWTLPLEGCVVVAISDIVAKSSLVLKPAKVIVSERPDMRGMAAATVRLTA